MSDISAVIVTFNSEKFVKLCLDYLCRPAGRVSEVIVIDNGSKDDTVKIISSDYPQVILISNRENLGAAKARNQGIEISRGKWVLVLDCDTVPEKNFISSFNEIEGDLPRDIGIVQPKILRYDRKTIYSAGIFLSWLRRFHDIGKGKTDNIRFNKEGFVFAASSAAAFYRREMLEEVKEKSGFFDSEFFFMVEDVDLGWRVKRRGYKTLYYPKTVCYHEGNSSMTDKKLRQFLCFRNRYLLIKKNERMSIIRRIPVILLYDLPRLLYLLLTNHYVLEGLGGIDFLYRGDVSGHKIFRPE